MTKLLKELLLITALTLSVPALTSCNSTANSTAEPLPLPQLSEMVEGEDIAIITTNFGDIKIRFFPEYAPLAVENFITHAKNGYYDGVIFHRVMGDFMIQGGDPEGTGRGGESIYGADFQNEVTASLRHIRGALSMANSGPDTNGSQFFIVQNRVLDSYYINEFKKYIETQNNVIGKNEKGQNLYVRDFYPTAIMEKYIADGGTPHLDTAHTVFGQVFEGMDVVDEIAFTRTDSNDRPLTDVVMEKVVIEKYSAGN